MTSFDLRPLAIGELLDRSFTLYRRHVVLFAGIMAAPSVCVLAGALVVQTIIFSVGGVDPQPTPDFDVFAPMLIAAFAAYIAVMFVYWIVYVLALGATTLAVAEIYGGGVCTIREAYARVRPHGPRLLWLTLLTALRFMGVYVGLVALLGLFAGLPMYIWRTQPIVVGLAAFVLIVGIAVAMILTFLFTLRYAVAVPALVLETLRARAAIIRSVALTRGYLWRAFLLTMCVMIVMYATMAVFQGPFMVMSALAPPLSATGFWLSIAGAVSGSVGMTLTTPVSIVGFAVLYYDLRVRKEALDLQVMMSGLDAAAGGLPPISPTLAVPAAPVMPE